MFIYVEFNLKMDLWKCAALLLWTEEKKSAGSHFYFPLIPALAAGMMMYWPGPWWNARALQWALAPPEGLAGFSSALPNPLQPSQCPPRASCSSGSSASSLGNRVEPKFWAHFIIHVIYLVLCECCRLPVDLPVDASWYTPQIFRALCGRLIFFR